MVVKPVLIFPIALLACSFIAGAATATSTSPELASAERKLNHIEANSRLPHPDQTPTVLSEQEINAYLASDQLNFPDGVESVTLEGQAGVVTGHAASTSTAFAPGSTPPIRCSRFSPGFTR